MSFTDELWKVELEMQKKDQSRLENSIEFAQKLEDEDNGDERVEKFRKRNKKKFKKQRRSSMDIFYDPNGQDEEVDDEDDVRSIISEEIKRRNSDDNSYFENEESESYDDEEDECDDIVFVHRDFIHKLVIADAYAPFTVNCLSNYPSISSHTLKEFDSDTKMSNVLMTFYLGIILTRHPSAVFTKEEFRNFKHVKEYDCNRFIFAADKDNNVFAYDVTNTASVINELENVYGFEKTLQILLSAFVLSNTESNVFQYGNAEYINAYREGIHNEDFMKVFSNTEGTKFGKNMEEDIVKIFTNMDVLKMEEAIHAAKSTADYLIDDEEEENINDPNDVPEEEEAEEELESFPVKSEEEVIKDTFISSVMSSSQPTKPVQSEEPPKVIITPPKEVEVAPKEEKPSGIFYTKTKPQPAPVEEPVVEDYDPSQPLDENFDPANLAKMMQTSNASIEKEKEVKSQQKANSDNTGKVGVFNAIN